DEIRSDYQRQFAGASERVLTFQGVKAMEWPAVTEDAQNLLIRARGVIEGIHAFVLKDEEQNDPFRLARVFQLMGISAYYANDIDAAVAHLERADRLYDGTTNLPPDQILPRAYTKHFLGVAAKNWTHEEAPRHANLDHAEAYLSAAQQSVEAQPKQ